MILDGVAPLRIQIVSDLHVDVAPVALRLAPGADVLVVAGDTCEGVEKGFAWLRAAVPAPTPIVTVAGNHEHYRHVLPDQLARGRDAAARHGITFLEDDEAVIGDVRFLGCTLWTDYALRGTAWQAPDMTAARDGMNDHRRITMSKLPWRRFLPRDALAMHVRSRAWLERVHPAAAARGPRRAARIADDVRRPPSGSTADPIALRRWLDGIGRRLDGLAATKAGGTPAAPSVARSGLATPRAAMREEEQPPGLVVETRRRARRG